MKLFFSEPGEIISADGCDDFVHQNDSSMPHNNEASSLVVWTESWEASFTRELSLLFDRKSFNCIECVFTHEQIMRRIKFSNDLILLILKLFARTAISTLEPSLPRQYIESLAEDFSNFHIYIPSVLPWLHCAASFMIQCHTPEGGPILESLLMAAERNSRISELLNVNSLKLDVACFFSNTCQLQERFPVTSAEVEDYSRENMGPFPALEWHFDARILCAQKLRAAFVCGRLMDDAMVRRICEGILETYCYCSLCNQGKESTVKGSCHELCYYYFCSKSHHLLGNTLCRMNRHSREFLQVKYNHLEIAESLLCKAIASTEVPFSISFGKLYHNWAKCTPSSDLKLQRLQLALETKERYYGERTHIYGNLDKIISKLEIIGLLSEDKRNIKEALFMFLEIVPFVVRNPVVIALIIAVVLLNNDPRHRDVSTMEKMLTDFVENCLTLSFNTAKNLERLTALHAEWTRAADFESTELPHEETALKG